MSEVHSPSIGSNTDPSLNPSSPYYIHPSEGPNSFNITHVLTGPNYASWSRAIRMALISKNKMGFLTGAIIEPPIFRSFTYHLGTLQYINHVLAS